MPAWTTEEFVKKAKEKHGGKYTYEKTKYTGSRDKVIVTCPNHGDFQITGNHHIRGGACAKCDRDRRAQLATKTTVQFIDEAVLVHGETYDYTKTMYKHSLEDVEINCRIHGSFLQKANIHLSGSGCQKCAISNVIESRRPHRRTTRYTTTEFVAKARSIHGDTYDYSESVYINCVTSIVIKCSIHGDFRMVPNNHIHEKAGCKKCGEISSASKRKHTLEDFLIMASATHGKKYDYSTVRYVNIDSKIEIICRIHGAFNQVAYNHVRGQNCPKCAANRYDTESFVQKANTVHKGRYSYDCTIYDLSWKLIKIRCSIHGTFQTQPYRHLQGSGCAKCADVANSSRMQIQWLEWQSVKRGIIIYHSDNIGEHKIINSRYSADGYDPITNTVFEFQGDFFHGNPLIYSSSEWNPKLKMTFGEAFQKTRIKRDHIIDQAYQLVEIWESDWKIQINKVKLIQRMWRKGRVMRNP